MSSGFGNLNGSGPQQVWANLVYSSYSQAGNYSRWYYEIRYYGNGYGSWANSTQYWSMSGFANSSGTFTIPSGEAYDTYKVLASGYFNKGHNADGYLSAGNLTASINTDHSSIGDGSVTVSSGTPPRIPKVPKAPTGLTVGATTPTTVTLSCTAPDNMGSAITGYTVQYATNDAFTEGVGTQAFSGTTMSNKVVTGLTPGNEYHFRVLATNSIGSGPYSTSVSARIGIGGKRFDGSSMIPFATAKRWDGDEFVDMTIAKRWDGSNWVNIA